MLIGYVEPVSGYEMYKRTGALNQIDAYFKFLNSVAVAIT